MTTDGLIYLGLAGETAPGRVVHSGLFRMADGSNEWEPLQRGLPEAPAVRDLVEIGRASCRERVCLYV